MERKDNFTKRAASNSLPHQVTVGGNLTSSSSSHSSSSPPDFLHQVRAALKHRKPLGARAVRVLDSLPKSSKSSGAFAPPSREGNAGKGLSQTLVAKGATRLTKEIPSKTGMTLPVNSSLTPPSVTSSFTDEHEGNVKSNQFGRKNDDSEMHDCQLELQIVQASEGLKQVQPFSAFSVQQPSHKYNGVLGNIIHVDEKAFHQQNAQNVQTSVSDAPFSEASRKENEPSKNRQFFQPATRSTLMQSSCVTTISAHSAPTFQYTGAPSTQMVGSTSQNIVGLLDSSHPEGKRVMFSEASSMKEKQDLNCEDIAKREVAANSNCLESHFPATSASSNPDIKPPQTIKSEKAARRKKYESNACFTVNGKLYQKLGKIGSGGSSEVHKVISTDCTIYALKKIKLKDRDYATTYGFCQEIGYLTKLKGKSNIIDLVDYEVTDKTLLQQAMEESITLKDGRIKGDEYIYMVLEYGEIDLAHMLMQKVKDMNCPSWNIDENWLRFYWQQMLEAVNTIHEERIVHSDLKPANFLLVKGSLKLIDFGIAKAIMSDTTNIQRDTQAGTLNYMPPEAYMWDEQDQAGGTIKCGRPSDIWSLGCILYQMVYGKTPFANYKTFLAKFNVITNANHEIIYEPVANPCLIDLMKRCLTWDRNKRWRIPQLLEHPFLKPPVPKEPNYHPFDALFDRVRLHRDEPEVSRLCSELRDVVSKLERDREQVRFSQTQKAST